MASLLPEMEGQCPDCGEMRKVSGGKFNPMLEIGETTRTPEIVLKDLDPKDFPCGKCLGWLDECLELLREKGLWDEKFAKSAETSL